MNYSPYRVKPLFQVFLVGVLLHHVRVCYSSYGLLSILRMMHPHQTIRQAIRERLQEESIGARRFEEKHGLPLHALHGILSRKRPKIPSVDRAAELCEALGLEFYIGPPREEDVASSINRQIDSLTSPERELLYEFRAFRKEVLSRLPSVSKADNIEEADALADPESGQVIEFPTATRQVEVRELAAAAGGGALELDETVTGYLAFRRDWLQSNGLDAKQCSVIGVTGESMEPTLPDGCSILVNRAWRRRRAGHIFVVRTGEGVVVKRAGKDESGGWMMVSDHPAWKSVPWPGNAEIIGEVKWTGRTL